MCFSRHEEQTYLKRKCASFIFRCKLLGSLNLYAHTNKRISRIQSAQEVKPKVWSFKKNLLSFLSSCYWSIWYYWFSVCVFNSWGSWRGWWSLEPSVLKAANFLSVWQLAVHSLLSPSPHLNDSFSFYFQGRPLCLFIFFWCFFMFCCIRGQWENWN